MIGVTLFLHGFTIDIILLYTNHNCQHKNNEIYCVS
jgi:hypothetical protein